MPDSALTAKIKRLHIAPNRPLRVALKDTDPTASNFDFDLQAGRYETIEGDILILPRPAVIALNTLDPAPGELIEITLVWDGRKASPREWTVTRPAPSRPAAARTAPPIRRRSAARESAGARQAQLFKP